MAGAATRIPAGTLMSKRNKERQHIHNVQQYWRHKPRNQRRYRAWYERNRDKRFFDYVFNKFGLSEEGYKTLYDKQKGRCAICGKTAEEMHGHWGANCKRLHLDHDHSTNKIRGFLCNGCNYGLGLFGDNPDILEIAAKYLRDSRWPSKGKV